MKHLNISRILIYLAGLPILALGIILNSKSNLGVSAIISVAYSISLISNTNFGDVTFLLYCVFVVMEMVIHYFQSKKGFPEKGQTLKSVLILDLLQVPFSLVFTRLMNVFSAYLPEVTDNFLLQLLVLAIGILCTGVGAAVVLNMRIIPNPGDGIVQAIADYVDRPVGLTKNCVDIFNVCLTSSIGLIFAHQLVGIGLGTIVAVVGVGRVIAIFNRLFKDRLLTAAGM